MRRPSCLVYDLYLATLGGGERVILEIAGTLADDFDVVVAGPELPHPERLASFGLASSLRMRAMPPARFPLASARADLAVYLANGIPLPSFARRSLLVVQFPMRRIGTSAPARAAERFMLRGWEPFVYSEYVRLHLKAVWGRDATVLHPPVELGAYHPEAKRRLILGVGRFFGVQHVKRQDALIEAFRALPAGVSEGWELVLAGGFDGSPSSTRYLDDLRAAAAGAAVRFEPNVSQPRLAELYGQATLFWHATGYGRPADHPERAEHFGMSTVEAMSYGAVPLVYADGGQTEIVSEAVGVLWHDLPELIAATSALLGDAGRVRAVAERATVAAQAYGAERFRARVRAIAAPPPASQRATARTAEPGRSG